MKAVVSRPGELGANEVARWHELQQLDPDLQHPFLSPEFAIVADRVRRDARVIVVEDGPTVVGFLPFRLAAGRVAAPITPGFNDLQGLVSLAGSGVSVSSILSSTGLRAWTFDHLLADHPFLTADEAEGTRPASTWIIDLARGWAGYAEWAQRERARYFTGMERKQRKLATSDGDYEFSYDEPDPTILRKLIAIKTSQCQAMGWRDAFADDWVRMMLEELSAVRQPALTGVLSALRINGEIIAADFSLRSTSIYAGWIIAYEPAWAQMSPGVVRWRHVIEAVADDGVRRIDLGRGADEFKRRFATGERPLREGTISGRGASARLVRSALTLSHKVLTPPPGSRASLTVRRYRRRRYELSLTVRRSRRPAPNRPPLGQAPTR